MFTVLSLVAPCLGSHYRPISLLKIKSGDFPGGAVFKTLLISVRGVGSIPGQGPKIPCALWPKRQKHKKQKQYCNQFNKISKTVHIKKSWKKKKKQKTNLNLTMSICCFKDLPVLHSLLEKAIPHKYKKPHFPQISWFFCLFPYLFTYLLHPIFIYPGLQQVRAPCWIRLIFLCFCRSERLGLVLLPQGNTLQSLNLLSLSRIMFTWNLTIHKVCLLCKNLTDTTKQYYVRVLRVQLPEKNKSFVCYYHKGLPEKCEFVSSLAISRVLYATCI